MFFKSSSSPAETRRNQLALPLVLIPVVIVAYFSFGTVKSTGLSWFSLHPLMMMLSFLSLAGLGVLTKKMGGRENTETHGNLMFLSVCLAAFGAYVIWSHKNAKPYGNEHLTTPHGQFGALVLCVFLPFPIVGYTLLSPDTGLMKTNKYARMAHRYGGRVTLLMGLITCCFGIASMEKDPVKAGGLMLLLLSCTPFLLV
jgi:hypothetical protein